MSYSLLSPDDPRWADFLTSSPHDFYHFPCYTALSAGWTGAEPGAVHVRTSEGELLVPVEIRDIPPGLGGCSDASSSYGYPSPLWVGATDPAAVRQAFDRYVDAGRELGLLTSFLRLHPLLSGQFRTALQDDPVRLHQSGETIAIDLFRPIAELKAAIRDGHSADIKRLREEGYRFELDRPEDFRPFVTAYQETMRRVGADAFYHFDMGYFQRLRDCLGSVLHWATVRAPDGQIAAAGLFPVTGGVIQYHLSGAPDAFRRSAASKLMLEGVMEWGTRAGHRTLHLGGGLGGRRDSLFRFKKGFGGKVFAYHTLRIVHDPTAVATANARAEDARDGEVATDDFFPPYRACTP